VRPDNGETRRLETRAQALCKDAGEAVRLSGISFDMTERKRMEEVARRLRAAPAGRQMRLVALTGYGQPEDVQRSVAAGFDGHLVKPVGMDDLARAIRPAPGNA
jgi:CheY-like chemotaxis protein